MTTTASTKPDGLPEMEYRFLGHTGLKVSALSLGGWLTYGGHVDKEGTFACYKAAYDAGCNFFDCAETYSDGENEKVMGEAIRKFGWKRNDLIYWGTAFGDVRANNVGLSRKHIVEGLDMSLQRLQLEYVDIVYAHRPDRQTPLEETVRAFNHVLDKGKALYWGTSEWSADEIAQAWRYADRLGLQGPVVEQPQYSMLQRIKVESEFARLYRTCEGLGLTTFSPLCLGLLTGKYRDGIIPPDSRLAQTQLEFIAELPQILGENFVQTSIAAVRRLEPIAERLGVPQSVLALAWILTNPHVSTAITGASRPEQVFQNVQAIAVYKNLTPEILAEIDEVLANKPQGEVLRY